VRCVRAELHLHAGRTDEATAAIASALELLRGAQAPNILADALVLSARVAAARGDLRTAEQELARAAALYREKGNLVSEQRTAEVRAALGLGPVTA
jgi:ATP/maltotriose-dependent transcriptional regulator MalT